MKKIMKGKQQNYKSAQNEMWATERWKWTECVCSIIKHWGKYMQGTSWSGIAAISYLVI